MSRSLLPGHLLFVFAAFLLGLLLLLIAPFTLAAAQLPLENPVWQLTTEAEFWFDASAKADFAEASRADFRKVAKPNFGNRSGALWLRLLIDNPGSPVERVLRLGPAMLKHVDFWHSGDPFGSHQVSGLAVPQSKRLLPGRFSLFPMLVPSGISTIYLRLASPSKLNPELSLWKMPDLLRAGEGFEIRTSLLFGGLLMTAQMALLYGFWMREWIWGVFGAAILGIVAYQSCYEGFAALWLWPEWPGLTYIVLPVSAALAQGLLVVFLLGFMPLAHMHRGWRLLWGLPVASALGLMLALLMDYRIGMPVMEGVSIVCCLVLPFFILAAWRVGFKAARFVLISFAIIYVSTLLRVGMLFGWWPSVYMADVWLMPLSGVAASAILLLGLIEHLRELRAAQLINMAELAEARDVAHRASRAKSLFLARVSHDLRAPLQVLAGYLDLAQRESLGGNLGHYLEVIGKSGRNMLGLIEELLQFARGEEGRLELQPRPILLHALIREIAVEGEFLAAKLDNSFVLELDLAVEVVELDSERLRSVLMNLLTNSCRLTRGGTIRLSLTVKGEGNLANMYFEVSDTGPGIALEDQERIFEAFEHGRSPDHSTGLGLAISRQLVRLMGGDLKVFSVPDQGATFYFSLLVPVAAESDVLPPTTFNAPLGYDGSVRSLLVVDDVEENRFYLQDLLTGMGFDVVLAESVEGALNITDKVLVDAAIVDQYLLDGNGWQILDVLKQRNPLLPVILVSAAPARPPADRRSTFRFDSELLKPIRIEALTSVLEKLLGLVFRYEGRVLSGPAPKRIIKNGPLTIDDLKLLRKAAHEGSLFEVEDWLEQWQSCNFEEEFLEQLEVLVVAVKLRAIVDLVDWRLGNMG